MKLSLCLLLVCSLSGWSSATKYSRTVTYDDQLVIRCDIQSDGIGSLLSHDEVDVWSVNGEHADVRLQHSLYQTLRHQLPECTVLHADVEALVQQFEENTEKRKNVNATWFEEYHRYDEIVDWYENKLGNDVEKNVVKFVPSIGKSVEGRDQPAVHITSAENSENKMQIYFQCQIHAREWISGATCMYIASYLVENSEKNERVTNLLKAVEFIFVPFVNPDGYEYTWTDDRLWRKNRQNNVGTNCKGVDLNRNYNDHWNQGGSSSNPCSETYHGPSKASEPETQNTQKYFQAQTRIIGAIDWHSYSQLILRPYGWTDADCPDEAQLKNLGDKMSTAIEAVHGKKYTSQKSIGLYTTTGTASDWFYSDDANVNNEYRAAGYTIELRDTGVYGFVLPPDQIIPTGEEIVPSVLVFAEELLKNPLKK